MPGTGEETGSGAPVWQSWRRADPDLKVRILSALIDAKVATIGKSRDPNEIGAWVVTGEAPENCAEGNNLADLDRQIEEMIRKHPEQVSAMKTAWDRRFGAVSTPEACDHRQFSIGYTYSWPVYHPL